MNATRAAAITLITLLGATACTGADVTSNTDAPVATTIATVAPAPEPVVATPVSEIAPAPLPTPTPPTPTVAPSEPEPEPQPEPEPDAEPVDDAEPGDDPDTDPTPTPGLDPAVDVAGESVGPGPDPGPDPLPGDLTLAGATTRPIGPTDLVAGLPTCGLLSAIPADALGIETMLLDVDADGAADTVTTYHTETGQPGWRLRVAISGGPSDEISIDGVGGAGMAKILGGVQTDWSISDPATYVQELLVQAGANASGVNLAVFGLDDDQCLFRFSDGDGDDLVLPVHASVGTMSGLLCDHVAGSGFLVALEADHAGGTTYDATSTVLDRSGTSLVPGTTLPQQIDSVTQAGWLDQFGSITCSGIDA